MNDQIHVLVCTNNDSAADFLRADLGSDAPESPITLTLGNTSVKLTLCSSASAEQVIAHDAVWLLARFADQMSLHSLRRLYALLGETAPAIPATLSIVRKAKEKDFKMSCPHCGQKLWIRDSDTSKRGPCPNCRKGFQIPTQEALLRRDLNLPEETHITVMRQGDPSCWREELVRLITHSQLTPSGIQEREVPEAAMNKTMILEITSEMMDLDPAEDR